MAEYYEVVKIKTEWCLRVKTTKKPVAWSKKDDAAWKSYVAEAVAAAAIQPPEESP